jgi:uncharacterized protein involved in exopolysaccharide biosynthesis
MTTAPLRLNLAEVDQVDVSLRDIVSIFFRRVMGMSIIFTIAMVIALIWIFAFRADLYEATAKIMVRIGHEQTRSVTVLNRETPVVGYRYQDVATEVHILSSTDVLERVVDKINLDDMAVMVRPEGFLKGLLFDLKQIKAVIDEWVNEALIKVGLRQRLSPRQQVITALSKGLAVGSGQESNILVAQLKLPYREGTAAVLNLILDTYLSSRMSYFQELDALNLFRQNMDRNLSELRKVETAIERLETRSNIVNLEVQEKLLLEREKELESEVKSGALEVQALRVKLDKLEQANGTDELNFSQLGAFKNDPFAANLMDQLAKFANHQVMIEMAASSDQRVIDSNRAMFQATLELLATYIKSVHAEQLAMFEGYRAALNDVRLELTDLHENEATWKNLLRKADLLEADYKFYRHELEQASVTSAMQDNQISTVKIIQHPRDNMKPAGIRKLYLIYISIVLSGFIAITWASLSEFLDHRIYTAAQAGRYLRVPVAGVVPWLKRRELNQLSASIKGLS